MNGMTGNGNENYTINSSAPPAPIYKRSELEAPFCPYCGDELDSVDMMNCYSSCSCGKWSEWLHMRARGGEAKHGYYYEPKKKLRGREG